MDYFRSQMKVGVLVFCSITLLVTLVLGIGGFQLFQTTKNIFVYFSFVNGLETDAPVRYAGVKIGQVKDIEIINDVNLLPDPEKRVKVKVQVLANVAIDRETKASVNTLGLMGEKYIELTSGFSQEILSEGDYILGEDLVSMRELMKTGKNIVTTLEHTMLSIDSIVGDEENRDALSATIIGTERVIKNLEEFTVDLNRIVTKNESTINSIITKANSVIVKLEALLKSTDDIILANKDDIRNMIIDLRKTIEHAKSFAAKVDKSPSSLVWKTREEILRAKEERKKKAAEERKESAAQEKSKTRASTRTLWRNRV